MAQDLARVQGRGLMRAVLRRRTQSGGWVALSLPGLAWLALFFLAPLYVVLAIVFGRLDPVFRTPVPVWNPLDWDSSQFSYVLDHIFGANGIFGPALARTAI